NQEDQEAKLRAPGSYAPSPGEHAVVSTQYSVLATHSSASSTQPKAILSTEGSAQAPAFFRTVAHLGIQAAEALEHAHELGVVHRDIKPANLLVDPSPLTTHHSPRLWITDFGLAQMQSQAGLTMTGDLLGTLRYMSPEQVLGQRL